MSLHIIVTGGTFDKRYDEVRGELIFTESHLPEILRQIALALPFTLEVNQLIDSLMMTNTSGEASILDACRAAPARKYVIIHGTDTMVETAALIGSTTLEKTIVLTGALVPYTVQSSDSLFNLGFAMATAQLLPHGVYIAMNGYAFPWHSVRAKTAHWPFLNNHNFEQSS